MPRESPPLKFYKTRLRFLTADEGGRHSPIRCVPSKYRPLFTFGDGIYYDGIFTDGPAIIEPGAEVVVEFALLHDPKRPLGPGDAVYVQEAYQWVASGKVLETGVKKYTFPD
jgi:hypothetical protein